MRVVTILGPSLQGLTCPSLFKGWGRKPAALLVRIIGHEPCRNCWALLCCSLQMLPGCIRTSLSLREPQWGGFAACSEKIKIYSTGRVAIISPSHLLGGRNQGNLFRYAQHTPRILIFCTHNRKIPLDPNLKEYRYLHQGLLIRCNLQALKEK